MKPRLERSQRESTETPRTLLRGLAERTSRNSVAKPRALAGVKLARIVRANIQARGGPSLGNTIQLSVAENAQAMGNEKSSLSQCRTGTGWSSRLLTEARNLTAGVLAPSATPQGTQARESRIGRSATCNEQARVEPKRGLRGTICLPILFGAIAASCGTPQLANQPLFGSGMLHPPPKPGDSISHTQMCECQTCEVGCCDGPEDDAAPEACGEGGDFTLNATCQGLSVRSCVSRCMRQVWRVHEGEACRARRPSSCCPAG